MSEDEIVVRLAARGDGVTDKGRYVPRSAPGDTVSGDTARPGPHRAEPPCRHFGVCGGCQLQHVDDWALGEFVSGRILGALAGVGIVPETPHMPHLSPASARRRASLRAVARKTGIDIGFNAERSHQLVNLTECHVLTPRLWQAVEALRPFLLTCIAPGHAAGIVLTETSGGIDLVLSGIGGIDRRGTGDWSDFAARAGIARISLESETVVQFAEPFVRLGGVEVVLPPGAFLQATADAEAALQAAVVTSCGEARRVADLFAGLGTFALPLSAGARVLAADAASAEISALGKAASAAGRRVEAVHRDLFRQPLTARELTPFDAVVLDPPRAGAKAQIETLVKSGVSVVVYVSCNPNTLARDAKRLYEGGYSLTELWPVGQFRWSTHVELVAAFRR